MLCFRTRVPARVVGSRVSFFYGIQQAHQFREDSGHTMFLHVLTFECVRLFQPPYPETIVFPARLQGYIYIQFCGPLKVWFVIIYHVPMSFSGVNGFRIKTILPEYFTAVLQAFWFCANSKSCFQQRLLLCGRSGLQCRF